MHFKTQNQEKNLNGWKKLFSNIIKIILQGLNMKK